MRNRKRIGDGLEILELKAALEKALSEKAELERCCGLLQGLADKYTAIQRNAERAESKELAFPEDACKKANAELDELNLKHGTLVEVNLQLESALENARTANAKNLELKAELAAEREKSGQLQGEIDRLTSEREKFISEYTRAKDAYERCADADFMHQRVTKAQGYADALGKENRILLGTVNILQARLEAAEKAKLKASRRNRAAKVKTLTPKSVVRPAVRPICHLDDEFMRTVLVR